MTQNQSNKITMKGGLTELTTSYGGKDLTFLFPTYIIDSYAGTQELIEKAGFIPSTMAQTISSLHTIINSDSKDLNGIKRIMKYRWLLAFTATLYIPNKGVYIQDNPQIKKGRIYMDESELEKKLAANDSNIRFIPFGFDTEHISPMQLNNNPYIIGLMGKEGAEKLSEITTIFKQKPYLCNFNPVYEPVYGPTTMASTLDSSWLFDNGRFTIGFDHGDKHYGHGFGVLTTRR